MKTFAVSPSGSFERIRLRQTGPHHQGGNRLNLNAFEVFGAVAGLPDDIMKLLFPMAPMFPFRGFPLVGIICYLTVKCGGNVHDKDVVEITASSSSNSARNAANLEDSSLFYSDYYKPGQWICLDFKTLRIEPTHYTIKVDGEYYLKSWAIEGSDDGASWTEIDRRENNNDLNKAWVMKTFAVSRPGSFEKIRLRQTGSNHWSNN
jgi:hypothetical protein